MCREKVVIQVTGNINKFIDKCIKRKIELLNINYVDNDNIIVCIYKEDLDILKKINYYSEITIYKRLGLSRLFFFCKRNLIYLITIIFCACLMSFLENVIFDVNVIHSNKEIIELVNSELNKNGIKPFTLAKSFKNIEKIKSNIIENNPKTLEWLSITRVGMKYVVRVEERIITNVEETKGYCHVVAKKDGMIKKIISKSGEIVAQVNDYVREGDILISGEIHLYDSVKDNVCAKGDVYAEVWYNVNLSIPLTYKEKDYTGNSRYNFILNDKKLFKEKYKYYDEENIYSLDIFGFNLKYYKELEYQYILKKYTVDEAIQEGLKQVDEKIMLKLKDDGEIVLKKILKKTQFNSRIDIEVFVVTLENIASNNNYIIEGDSGDTE